MKVNDVVQFTENQVAYIYTTKEEADSYEADTFTISRGMVNTMGEIRGVDIWVNFTETEDGILCEIRSAKYNINPIAVKYGGGGHAKASGATVKNKAQAMEMLRDIDKDTVPFSFNFDDSLKEPDMLPHGQNFRPEQS